MSSDARLGAYHADLPVTVDISQANILWWRYTGRQRLRAITALRYPYRLTFNITSDVQVATQTAVGVEEKIVRAPCFGGQHSIVLYHVVFGAYHHH